MWGGLDRRRDPVGRRHFPLACLHFLRRLGPWKGLPVQTPPAERLHNDPSRNVGGGAREGVFAGSPHSPSPLLKQECVVGGAVFTPS